VFTHLQYTEYNYHHAQMVTHCEGKILKSAMWWWILVLAFHQEICEHVSVWGIPRRENVALYFTPS